MKSQEKTWNKLYEKGLTWKKTGRLKEDLTNKIVLELGVGNGKTLKTLLDKNPKHITAIDISDSAIKLIKIKDKKVLLRAVNFLKFNTKEKFDVIVCYYFLNNFLEKQRKKVIEKMKSMLKENGVILFEDFGNGDFRQNGNEIEKNTIEKENGLICHFFDKREVRELFEGFDIKIKEKTFNPVRKNKDIQRKIISAKILPNNAPGRI